MTTVMCCERLCGIEPDSGGYRDSKNDAGKWRFSLLPLSAIISVIAVLEFGAQKYAVDNWKSVPDARQRYFDASIRHITAWWQGEQIDSESGLPHLAHAVCCLLFLMWFDEEDKC
ncbi:dATP/dGTP diphosphohydrolase domain-containing protein [Pectobacterium carotovorum]|uniref:dATP/dGTP diphosphohydrolase domain-containing protein n=1 Tax=Pectobacterium carotovorum TaxID=554 RepID=UPI0021F384ED|nr:dATP/dGTP diphosphohydrolase domain-containing protein [Pectobacterium carotovorum]